MKKVVFLIYQLAILLLAHFLVWGDMPSANGFDKPFAASKFEKQTFDKGE